MYYYCTVHTGTLLRPETICIQSKESFFTSSPLARLVSAFEDKILRSRHERRYYQQLAARLKFDFSNFVDHVLSESRRGNNCSLLRGGCGVDEHFRPYYSS